MIRLVNKDGLNLSYKTRHSACFDITYSGAEACHVHPGDVERLSTGLYIDQDRTVLERIKLKILDFFGIVPCLEILTRSSYALNNLFVANAPGIVDLDYPGEIKVALLNNSDFIHPVELGDRVAQARIVYCFRPKGVSVSKNKRKGGFGSTGA